MARTVRQFRNGVQSSSTAAAADEFVGKTAGGRNVNQKVDVFGVDVQTMFDTTQRPDLVAVQVILVKRQDEDFFRTERIVVDTLQVSELIRLLRPTANETAEEEEAGCCLGHDRHRTARHRQFVTYLLVFIAKRKTDHVRS